MEQGNTHATDRESLNGMVDVVHFSFPLIVVEFLNKQVTFR